MKQLVNDIKKEVKDTLIDWGLLTDTYRHSLPKGFHGDKYLISVTKKYLEASKYFVETGTNAGNTLRFVAKRHPNVECFSCEIDPRSYQKALEATSKYDNVAVHQKDSLAFLIDITNPEFAKKKSVFWLDAHGRGFRWPLKQEVKFIAQYFDNPFIFIDDFRVPDKEEFGFDQYDGQECSVRYLKDVIPEGYVVGYPNYTEHTSTFHPLRGWGLLCKKEDKISHPKITFQDI